MRFLPRVGYAMFIFAYLLSAQNSYGEVQNLKLNRSIKFGMVTPPSNEDIDNLQEELDSVKGQLPEDILAKLMPFKSEFLPGLIIIAKGKKYLQEQRIVAMQILGEMREDSCAYILVDNLLLGYKGLLELNMLTSSKFPVGFAIIKMGSHRSTRISLLNKIKDSRDEEIIRLCAFVLMKIEDKDVAKFILNHEIQKEGNEKQKANLEKALTFLK